MTTRSQAYKAFKTMAENIKIDLTTGRRLKTGESYLPSVKYNTKGATKQYWESATQKLKQQQQKIKTKILKRKTVKQIKQMGEKLTGNFSLYVLYWVSKPDELRKKIVQGFYYNKNIDHIKDKLDSLMWKKFEFDGYTITKWEYRYNDEPLTSDIWKMTLNDVKFFKLNVDIEANKEKIEENCVISLIKKYIKKSNKRINEIIKETENIKVWTVDKFIHCLKMYKINYTIYYKNFEVLASEKYDNKKMLYAIVKNEHIYHIEKKELKIINDNKKNIMINDIIYDEKINEIINNNIEISPIYYPRVSSSLVDDKIINNFSEFIMNDHIYTNNKSLYESYKLYSQNIDVILTPNYKIYTPLVSIAKYNKLYSSFIHNMNGPKAPIYETNKTGKKTIDKNKAYLSAFLNLRKLPIINSKCHITEYDGNQTDTNFYYISYVKNKNYNMLCVGWCSGYRLIGHYDDVIISKYLTPELVDNPYRELLLKMSKDNLSLTNEIFTIFTGVMECQSGNTNNIYNEILKCPDGYSHDEILKVDKLYVSYTTTQSTIKYNINMMPIKHYIIDYTVYELNMLIKKNNLDVVRLRTDAVSFTNTDNIYFNEDKIYGWKYEVYKPTPKNKLFITNNNEPIDKTIYEGYKFNKNINTLFNCSAGSGKTTLCINKILPLLTDKILILSATHKALTEYYYLDNPLIEVKTMDYIMSCVKNGLKDYKYIIIDEAGLLNYNMWEYLYKNIHNHNIIYAFGDMTQLPPVMENSCPLNNKNIINTLFKVSLNLSNNWRNNYTFEEYEEMKNGTYNIKEFENKIINKINDVNICYYNNTRNHINDICTKDWTDNFSTYVKRSTDKADQILNMKVKKGGKLICTTNNLKQLKIFNSHMFNIVEYTNDYIILKGDDLKDYKLTIEQFKNNFNYGYALTLYKIQGMTVEYEKIGIFDWEFIKQCGKRVYTTLSRIKTELKNKPEDYNINDLRQDIKHKELKTTIQFCKCKNPKYTIINANNKYWCENCDKWQFREECKMENQYDFVFIGPIYDEDGIYLGD